MQTTFGYTFLLEKTIKNVWIFDVVVFIDMTAGTIEIEKCYKCLLVLSYMCCFDFHQQCVA